MHRKCADGNVKPILNLHNITVRTSDRREGHSDMNVASLYENPSTSSPPASPGKIVSGPVSVNLAALIHCGVLLRRYADQEQSKALTWYMYGFVPAT
jgi:hypothetical protein